MDELISLVPVQLEAAEWLVLGGVFLSVLLVVAGAGALLAPEDPVERRLAAGLPAEGALRGAEVRLRSRADEISTGGVWSFLLPKDEGERSRVRRALWNAGFQGEHAVRNYFAARTLLALLLPLPVVLVLLFTQLRLDAGSLQLTLAGQSLPAALILVLLLVLVGFYGPVLYLRLRTRARQEAIRRAFPSALDLLQVAVEAGLGVDAALARVAEEMATAQPTLAGEFALVVSELRAGRQREAVLADFAARTGVEEVRSFVTVVQQTVELGTNLVDALRVYASEMRTRRMVLAEEKANKLPVKLSAALALIMMPAILALVMGPIVIRAVRVIVPALGVS